MTDRFLATALGELCANGYQPLNEPVVLWAAHRILIQMRLDAPKLIFQLREGQTCDICVWSKRGLPMP